MDDKDVKRDRKFEQLRKRAINLLKNRNDYEEAEFLDSYEKILQELDIYQTELEIQNMELRQMQEQLTEARDRYYLLFNSAPVGYLLVNETGIIEEANLKAVEILDNDLRHIIKQPLASFIHEDHMDEFIKFRKNHLKSNSDYMLHSRIKRSDNRQVDVQLNYTRDEGGSVKPGARLVTITDVTKQKTTEEKLIVIQNKLKSALKITHRKYEQVVENSSEGIAVTQNGRLKFVNNRICEVLGIGKDELIDEIFENYIHPEDRDMVTQKDTHKLKRNTKPKIYDFRIIDRKGRVRWLRNNAVPINWGGEPAGLNFMTDITVRKELSKRLDQQRELLQKIINNIPVMLTVYDNDAKMSLINNAFEEALGWTSEEIDNIDLMEVCYPDPGLRKEVWEFMQNPNTGWRDFEITTRWGTKLHTSWTNIALDDGTTIGLGIDITERVEAVREIKRQKEFLQKILDNIPVLIGIFDENVKMIMVNKKYEEVLGWSLEDARKVDIMKEIYPDPKYREEIFEFVGRPDAGWKDIEVTTRWRTKLIVSWSLISLGQSTTIAIGIDITERKNRERELRNAKEKLEMEGRALEEKNIALKQLIESFDRQKENIEKQVAGNIEEFILPALRRLKAYSDKSLERSFEMLEANLHEIASPFASRLKTDFSKLSPRELEVCRMIKTGMTTKEIAQSLGLSHTTAQKYRELIRKKLGLTGKDVNLNTFLQSIDDEN